MSFNFSIPHCPYCNGDIVNSKCKSCRYTGKGEIVKPFSSQAEYIREAYKDRNTGDYDRTFYGEESK